jgi:hypothetical protein
MEKLALSQGALHSCFSSETQFTCHLPQEDVSDSHPTLISLGAK